MTFVPRLAGAVAVAAAATLSVAAAHAGDLAAGRQKALQCQACHGLDGLSKMPGAPNIAGQPVEYLVKALNEFRHGVRRNEMMSVAAQTLSDADVTNLAAYYGAIAVSVELPEIR